MPRKTSVLTDPYAISKAYKEGHNLWLKEVRKEAKRRSLIGYRFASPVEAEKQMIKWGRPYALKRSRLQRYGFRHYRKKLDPSIANVWTGRLSRSWDIAKTVFDSSRKNLKWGDVINTAPYGRHFYGDSYDLAYNRDLFSDQETVKSNYLDGYRAPNMVERPLRAMAKRKMKRSLARYFREALKRVQGAI